MSIDEYFNNTISKDLLALVTSTHLGNGVAREVYRSALDPSCVFKFESTGMSFQNILEWEAWDAVRHTKWAKWFAPCVSISPCGTILTQKYARDVELNELPTEVPAFFTDLKHNNWGVIDNQIVCRDYGRTLLLDRGLSNKMRKADW